MDTTWLAALGGGLDPAPMLSALLLSLRIGVLLAWTPLLAAFLVPRSARVLVALGLAGALSAAWPQAQARVGLIQDLHQLIAAALTEAALGGVLALGVLCAFAAVSLAGRLIDVQAGFGMAQVLDPATRRQVPLLQAGFDHLGVLLFFLAGGPHALLRALAFSVELIPPGAPWAIAPSVVMLLRQVAAVFSLGLALAAPVAVCLLLLELAIGVLGRSMPQMNMLVVGIPLKIPVALAALAAWLPGMTEAMMRAHAFVFRGWADGLAAMAGS